MVLGIMVGLHAAKKVKRFVSNFQEHVTPRLGSVVHCSLAVNLEHTGIYIGDDTIVHLSGNGIIEAVSSNEFLERLEGLNFAINNYVSCYDDDPVGSKFVAERAASMVGEWRDYNIVLDNCHQFTSGCLSGNFENADNFFWMVENKAFDVLGANCWRVWER